MLMDSLWTRKGRRMETPRKGLAQASPGAMNGRSGERRSEMPEPLAMLPALRGSRYLLMAIKDRDGRYLEANEPYARALGLSVAAMLGRLDRDLLAPRLAGELAQRERLALRGVSLRPELESFDDEEPLYLVERLPILDAQGQLRAVCTIAMPQAIVPLPEIALEPVLSAA